MPEVPTTPASVPSSNEQAQKEQIRQAMQEQIAELKREIQQIQQQSLKAMQDAIDAAFRNHVG